MVKFWDQNQPLEPTEQRLVSALFSAHHQCVFRPNCSTLALQQAGGGSRSIVSAYIAALATLGEMHGPIEDAYEWVYQQPAGAVRSLPFHEKIAGWGNSFIRGRIDDAFLPVDQILEAQFPRTHGRIRDITAQLAARGKHLFPNPAAYTAATAFVLGMPRHLSPMLFVQARLEAWAEIFHRMMTATPEQKERAA